MRGTWVVAAAMIAGCTPGGTAVTGTAATGSPVSGTTDAVAVALLPVTISGQRGTHAFQVELARTPAEQERGLMFRTDIPKDGGMLFAPYPATGGAPEQANFWMKNTPSPLDIIFIRADHSIARIAENTVPFSEALVSSGEPIAAVLELRGGRSAELGIGEGDAVTWPSR